MRFRLLVCFACLMSLFAACEPAPPTLIVMIVTPTPGASESTPSSGSRPRAPTMTPTEAAARPTPDATPTLDPFPTPTMGEIQVAEQLFEHGRMFWVQPLSQIWILVVTGEGRGEWHVYPDNFDEGDEEFDPDIEPPDGLFQPRRGFGKLWRDHDEVRQMMGWAVTPDEFGYISRYEYHPGGRVNARGEYIPEPGYHILFSLYEEAFRFNETDQTWQLGRGED
jgi:hypothetical protein